jgi:protein-S-isoprenylcysteine O-methyltransferase Ste14
LSPARKARVGGVGTLLLAAAVWLFWRAHRDLGTNWSPSLEIGAGQTLVTKGVYHTIRHPMYASHLLWGLGQALLLHNWIAGLAGLLTFLPLYLLRLPREERMMLDHFGDAYRAYAAETGRIVPRLRG